MNLIDEFVPDAGYPNLKIIWRTYAIVLLIFTLPPMLIGKDWFFRISGAGIFFVVLTITIIFDRHAVKVSVSQIDGRFTYRTIGLFGKEKDMAVALGTATVSYKYTRLSKYRKGYRLRLYNNYFNNRITLKQADDGTGFNEKQLEQMVTLINKYRGMPVDTILPV